MYQASVYELSSYAGAWVIMVLWKVTWAMQLVPSLLVSCLTTVGQSSRLSMTSGRHVWLKLTAPFIFPRCFQDTDTGGSFDFLSHF